MSAPEFLCAPYPFSAVTGFSGAGNPANLGTERLGRTAAMGGAVVDLGYARPVDTVATLASDSASASTVYALTGYGSLNDALNNTNAIGGSGNFSSWASSDAARRLHRQGIMPMPASITARFWRVDVSAASNVGRLVLGQRYTASDTRDVGWSFKVIDLGDYKQSATKLDNSLTRGKTLQFSWTWSWLTEAEARGALLDLAAYAGITRDVLLCLDPAATDLHNMIGYGKITEMPEITNVSGGAPDLANAFKVDLTLQSRLLLNL